MTTKSLTVTEGQGSGYVEVRVTLPPRFLCPAAAAAAACRVQVSARLEVDADVDARCDGGAVVPQAVLVAGWGDDPQGPACGLAVTDANWFRRLRIGVRAKVDRVKDKDQERRLAVVAEVIANGTIVRRDAIGSVKVSGGDGVEGEGGGGSGGREEKEGKKRSKKHQKKRQAKVKTKNLSDKKNIRK